MAQFVFLHIIQGRSSVPAFSIRVSQCGLEPGKPPKLRWAAREVGSSIGAPVRRTRLQLRGGARAPRAVSAAAAESETECGASSGGCAVVATLRRTENWQFVLGRRNMQSHTT